eukprot:NODE_349_length_919_cov_359.510101_g341_i0.p1 GENE.NODE_349_length_919_cov_359.510101_g341_i0~~NODE_349_length_919_cov_359.510101_g341_i0.p1  ORF type:complete len:216 (-),score=70.81 NODE_349_length_919_cov_359.510101_g341_i0:169-816(-)
MTDTEATTTTTTTPTEEQETTETTKQEKKPKRTYAQAQADRKEQFQKRYQDKFPDGSATPTQVWEVLPQEGELVHYACHLTKFYFVTARQCSMHMDDSEYKDAITGTTLTQPTEEFLTDVQQKAEVEKERRKEVLKSRKRKPQATTGGDKAKQQVAQLQRQVESRDRRNVELTALLDRKREENFALKQEKHALILENQQLRKSLNGLLKQLKQDK